MLRSRGSALSQALGPPYVNGRIRRSGYVDQSLFRGFLNASLIRAVFVPPTKVIAATMVVKTSDQPCGWNGEGEEGENTCNTVVCPAEGVPVEAFASFEEGRARPVIVSRRVDQCTTET